MGWQWHQLDHTQIICTSLQTDNHASTSPLSFYRLDALPATQLTASKCSRQYQLAVPESRSTYRHYVWSFLTYSSVWRWFSPLSQTWVFPMLRKLVHFQMFVCWHCRAYRLRTVTFSSSTIWWFLVKESKSSCHFSFDPPHNCASIVWWWYFDEHN